MKSRYLWIGLAALGALALVWIVRMRTAPQAPVEASPSPMAPVASASPSVSPVAPPQSGGIGRPSEPRRSPPPSEEQVDAQSFRELSRKTLSELPTVRELQQMTNEQLHTRPLPLQRAGQALGEIAQELSDHPELAPEGIRFYEDCALKEELVKTVRALCYRNLRKWVSETGAEGIDESRVPTDVRRLADQIP